MYEWTNSSLLKFHPEKCVAMRIGRSTVPTNTYTMGPEQVPLKQSSVEKDIGVFIDSQLKFDEHINSKVNKANACMGLIRRTYEYIDEVTFKTLYKALVRPHLEYANQVWSPNLKRQETVIENVQRRATKLVLGLAELSYEERLRKLGLPTLKYRRKRGDMIEMYKILTNKYDERVTNFVKLNESDKGTRGHRYKIEKKQIRLETRKASFICRSTDLWNNLPEKVIEAPTTQAFEARLDRHWLQVPWRFNWEEEVDGTRRTNAELAPEAGDGLLPEVFM